MASRSDVERALLYALLEPPPFDGDLEDPWFSAGPTPEPGVVERLPGEFVSALHSREEGRVDGDDDEWLTHFYMSYLR